MHPFIIKTKYQKTSILSSHNFSIQATLLFGCVLLFLFSFLYIIEQNAVLSAKRNIIKQGNIVKDASKEVSNLEILAIELASHKNLKAVAFAGSMVVSKGLQYISIEDDSVAMK